MSRPTKNPSSRTLLLAGIAVCASAAALLILLKRPSDMQRQAKQTPDGDPMPPPGIPTPQTGDILLYHNAKGMNKLITLFTRSPFYHAAIYDTDNKVVEAQLPGIQHNNIGIHYKDYVVAPAPGGKGREALEWAKTQIGDAYDRLDIGVIILDHLFRFIRLNYQPHDKYTCGEFVATAFHKAGVPLFPEDQLSNVVPGDFAPLVPEEQKVRVR